MRPGSRGPQEQLHPSLSSACLSGSSSAGHWHLNGLKQRICTQPGKRFWTSVVHLHCRLGGGCFQVSGFTPDALLIPILFPHIVDCLKANMLSIFAGPEVAGGGCP